jgi:hypothetical protein
MQPKLKKKSVQFKEDEFRYFYKKRPAIELHVDPPCNKSDSKSFRRGFTSLFPSIVHKLK